MSDARWYGDNQNGIEVRIIDGAVDEIVLYVDGKCAMHMEQMSDSCFWFGLYVGPHTVHANCAAKQAEVTVTIEGWKD